MHCLYTWSGFKNGQQKLGFVLSSGERDDMGFAVLLLHAYYNVSDYISMADSVACMRSSSHIACHVYMYILPLEKHTYGMCPGWHTPGYIFYEL